MVGMIFGKDRFLVGSAQCLVTPFNHYLLICSHKYMPAILETKMKSDYVMF